MVVTRFAPSPTGYLHIGSARTALFCWLWAKNQQGKFILRIEDTDRERSTDEAVQVILEGMQWLGLNWDEGPIFQTKRFDRYKAIAKQLLENDQAYKCYCSKDRLEVLRAQQIAAKEKPRYDGYCLRFPHPPHDNMPYVLRFKTPTSGVISFHDLVKGQIEFQNNELDDLILIRSDGTPTYNFTVVVDDIDMEVTHVLRGDDHVNNTPRQIHILKALGAKIPEYGHMPMLLSADGKKLSKRTGAVSVLDYREQGFLPHALLNYLVRLGWSHGDQEIFSIDEMIQYFDIHQINVAQTAINPEKLLWLNQHYLKTQPPEKIAEHLSWHMQKRGVDLKKGPSLTEVVIAQRDRCKTLVDMSEQSQFLYEDDLVIEGDLAKKHFNQTAIPALHIFLQQLKNLNEWTTDAIHDVMSSVVAELEIKLGLIAQPVRIAVTGSTVSPPVDVTLYLLGKKRTIARLQDALLQMQEPS